MHAYVISDQSALYIWEGVSTAFCYMNIWCNKHFFIICMCILYYLYLLKKRIINVNVLSNWCLHVF